MSESCEICGRTPEEFAEEFGRDVEVKEYDGMMKCDRCATEFDRGSGKETKEEPEEMRTSKDWKDRAVA